MLKALRYPGPVPPGVTLPAEFGSISCEQGEWAWSWTGPVPDLPIPSFGPLAADPVGEWGLDHVVLGTSDVEATVAALVAAGGSDRRRGETVRGQVAAFVLAGTLVEVIGSGDGTRLVGIAFETDHPLDEVAAAWRAEGVEVTDSHPAVQPGRSIMSVRGLPVAVMTRR